MKFSIDCKVYSIVFSKLLRQYYKDHFKDMDMGPIIKAVKKEYKEMILRTPGLSKDNHLAGNLKGAAYFFAMAKKVPGMTPELMDDIINVSFASDFMQNLHRKKREKGTLFSEKEQERMYRDSLRSQKSQDEMDWTYTCEKGKDEYSYTMTRCGVCRLAERENMKEYLPCLCKMDYPKYKMQGATLIRTKTIANGDGCCDFHLVRDK